MIRALLAAWLTATAAAPAIAAADGATSVEELSWLAGHWLSESGGRRSEEIWTDAAGGVLVGVHRDVDSSGQVAFEFLRITEQEGWIVYLASPGGRPATAFRLVGTAERTATFENSEHDFPQRIVYRLDADGVLSARIEGEVDGETRSSEWRWRRRDD
jgi:hypothetical protein